MKNIPVSLFAVFALVAFAASAASASDATPAIEIKKVAPSDSDILEAWERVTNDADLLGVSAMRSCRDPSLWRVTINVAEFVRREPLAARLDQAITSALKRVEGVDRVTREDREVWVVKGKPKGDELVRAGARSLDQLAGELREYMKALEQPRR